ncbi:MAG: YcxB family protein [Cyclobacteriaceae bacterium]|nr:YcxB family protein [Cyclobacteriaceae bacterium]
MRSWIMTTLLFLCLAYLFYRSDNSLLGNLFLVYAGISTVLFPFYTRWRYKKHYLKFIRDTYKNRFGETCDIEFTEDNIVTRDKSGELKINKGEIEEINEIQNHYFLKARSGMAFIVPKSTTTDIESLKREIVALTANGAKHSIELDWKWK